jgi:hypothetical protein
MLDTASRWSTNVSIDPSRSCAVEPSLPALSCRTWKPTWRVVLAGLITANYILADRITTVLKPRHVGFSPDVWSGI